MGKRKRHNWSKTKKKKGVKTSGDYWVEAIKDWALDGSGKLMFLLKWEDYEESENSWEFDEHVFDCEDLREEFMTNTVNGRHPPKYSWQEFDKFVEYLKLIIDDSYNDLAVLMKLSTKKRTFAELKSAKTIKDIKSKIECEFNKLLTNEFKERKNSQRLEAKELVEKVAKQLKIDDNFRTITDFFEFVDKRKSMITKLKVWEETQNDIITKEGEGLPISVVNDVDLELPKLEKYITRYIIDESFKTDLKLEKGTPVHGCDCVDCYQNRDECCTSVVGFPMVYNSKGLLSHSRYSTMIFECNSKCKCSKDCPNRVIQRGRQVRLEIFRTENAIRGWGIRTLDPIGKGQFVTEYTGEIVSLIEAEKRPTTYLFDLSTNLNSTDNEYTYVVDASKYGNIARFINHSCEPNCRILFAWIDNYDKLMPLISIFATKPIRAYDELTYDYGMELIDLYNQNSFNYAMNEDAFSTDSGTESSSNYKAMNNGSDHNDSDQEENIITNLSQTSIENRNTRLSYKKIDF